MSEQIVSALARLFSAGYFLTDPVAGGFALFRSLNHPTPVGVDRLRAVYARRERIQLPPAAHAFAKRVHLLPKHAQIMHCYCPGIPGSKDLNPQFGSITVLMLMVRLGTSTESITIFV